MSELDYSDYVTIKVIRVKDETGPTHWEIEAVDSRGDCETYGTSPTFAGAIDMGIESIYEIDFGKWARFDANNKDNNA